MRGTAIVLLITALGLVIPPAAHAVGPAPHYLMTASTSGQFRPYRITPTDSALSGQANGNRHSFQAVGSPGRYPRHGNHEMRLDLRADDAVFAGDASFAVTAPLA